MEFFTILIILVPVNMNALLGTIKTQLAIISFEKILENWVNDDSSLAFPNSFSF